MVTISSSPLELFHCSVRIWTPEDACFQVLNVGAGVARLRVGPVESPGNRSQPASSSSKRQHTSGKLRFVPFTITPFLHTLFIPGSRFDSGHRTFKFHCQLQGSIMCGILRCVIQGKQFYLAIAALQSALDQQVSKPGILR